MFRREIIRRYTKIYGKDFFNACFKPLKKSIRVNTLKISVKALKKRMVKQRFVLKEGFVPDSFVVERERKLLGGTLEHLLGYFYVQELTSMVPALWLKPKKTDVVLDMCAAPGGKTTHLSQLMSNQGLVVAVDMDKSKNVSVINNLQRLGCTNVAFYNTDSSRVLNLRKFKLSFDKILLDAPCSCSGITYKDPAITEKLSLGYMGYHAKKQKRLLRVAYGVLKKKGRVVYSTCSIDPLENQGVLDYGEKLGFRILRKQQFLPHEHGTAGFFVAEMIKR
jgi:NOL1/NOP2/sun family putative RNA methylase